MKVVTAINDFSNSSKISCFLGGGITNCPDWQQKVISTIKNSNVDTSNLVLYNPRRPNFPIDDPNAAPEQIEWEFRYLNNCDIFTMYFCNTKESDQPICFYELGRYIALKTLLNEDYINRIVVSCEKGFSREQDVIYQLKCIDPHIDLNLNCNPEIHTNHILVKYRRLINY